MLVKQTFSLSDFEKLNCLFIEMLDKTNSRQIKNLEIQHSQIRFTYLMGNIENMSGPILELPMFIELIENNYTPSFCIAENYTCNNLDIQETTKFESFFNYIVFVNQNNHLHVATQFDSFSDLDIAIDRILNYTFLLVLDSVTHDTPFKH